MCERDGWAGSVDGGLKDDRSKEISTCGWKQSRLSSLFALPLLSNDKGVHTNAIYGFAMILMKMLEDEKPTHMLVAFDAGKTTFRHETFKEYKGGRQKLRQNYQNKCRSSVSY